MPNGSNEETPVIYAIGGPNGAGETTFAREFLPAVGVEPFLNADSTAAGLSPLRPEATRRAYLAAKREAAHDGLKSVVYRPPPAARKPKAPRSLRMVKSI